MFTWHNLELSDYERKFVRIYKDGNKPGVLRRTYKVVLNSPAQPTKNLPVEQLGGQIQIARRARVFALTFSGNTDSWRLEITNASGTTYTVKDPRKHLDPIVSSMVPGNTSNAVSLGGLVPPLALNAHSDGIGPSFEDNGFLSNQSQPFPLLIDPNWVLMPNETLIFNGTPIPVSLIVNKQTVVPPLTLTIGIHVWEFPVMGTASSLQREVG